MGTFSLEASSTYQPMCFLTTSSLHFTTIEGDMKEFVALELNKMEMGVALITPINWYPGDLLGSD